MSQQNAVQRAKPGEEESAAMVQKLGTVIISPTVLSTIARLTALAVPGVVRMSPSASGAPLHLYRLPGLRSDGGVKVKVTDEAVVVDIYIVAAAGVNLLQLSREVQSKVTRAIHDIVGMAVQEINVHIMDVLDVEESKV